MRLQKLRHRVPGYPLVAFCVDDPPGATPSRSRGTPESWKGTPRVNFPSSQCFSQVEDRIMIRFYKINHLLHSGVPHEAIHANRINVDFNLEGGNGHVPAQKVCNVSINSTKHTKITTRMLTIDIYAIRMDSLVWWQGYGSRSPPYTRAFGGLPELHTQGWKRST